jgi:hydroxymethylpyrimidine/phosphomethylpyrimidine kinase
VSLVTSRGVENLPKGFSTSGLRLVRFVAPSGDDTPKDVIPHDNKTRAQIGANLIDKQASHFIINSCEVLAKRKRLNEKMNHPLGVSWPVVLSIAGFDPSSGAGIAADLKTFAAHCCYGVAALTALTVQNTQGVTAVYPTDPVVLKDTIAALLADAHVKTIKVGMLANRANAEVVGEVLESNPALPSVLDPVIRSSGGKDLADAACFEILREQLIKRAHVITPNLFEASAMTGLRVESQEAMKAAAHRLVEMGARAVVVTGGHLDKPTDVLFDGSALEVFTGDHVKPDNTHGAGCTFASAIAANLALGRQLRDAVVLAKAYVTEAIRKAYLVGPGRVPLNHLYRMVQPPRPADSSAALAEPVG